ncbi:MAG: S9 family peptidase [Candidatus Moduliflexus flocculans]|nr:S9 family peptidase [Candidatus Moduliflexus flocculans]
MGAHGASGATRTARTSSRASTSCSRATRSTGRAVGHTGHSYGGFMTNWLITQYPDRFAAAITGAGITQLGERLRHGRHLPHQGDRVLRNAVGPGRARPHDQAVAAHATPGAVRTPTLFIHGEVDQRVPCEEGEQMLLALRRRGVPAKMIQYAGQPHGIGGHWNNVHRMLNELGMAGHSTSSADPDTRKPG